jgi:phosphopantetheinyl transferase
MGFQDADHAAERAKALESDRRLLRTSRWLVRASVARRAGVCGSELVLNRDEWGRPRVAGPAEATHIAFSVAHTRDVIAVIEGDDDALGVDVERIDPTVNVEELGRIVLAPAEQATLAAIPPPDRVRHFFWVWVVKEAVLKAIGTGFRIDPVNVIVHVTGYRAQVDLVTHPFDALGLSLPPRWSISLIELDAHHVVATALPQHSTGAAPHATMQDWHTLAPAPLATDERRDGEPAGAEARKPVSELGG